MKDSTDKNNDLDQYGVWVKTPPRNPQEAGNASSTSSIDDTLPDFSFLDSATDTVPVAAKNSFETEDTSLTPDELSRITGSVEEPAKAPSSGEEEISLDDFITGGFSDAPAEETAPKAKEAAPADNTEVSLDDFLGAGDSSSPSAAPDGDISLDSFLGPDASSGNGEISLDDFMGPSSQREEAKPAEIVDEKPMDIDLSFDDAMPTLDEATVEEPHEETKHVEPTSSSSTEEVDLSSFDTISDAPSAKQGSANVDLDNFDSVFNTIVDEGSSPSSSSTPVVAADGTESVNLEDFGIEADSGEKNVILPSGHTERVQESTDYAMDVTTDEETVSPEPMEDGSSDDLKEESVVIEAQPDTAAATATESTSTNDTISFGAPTEDDFDVDSILNSVKDEQGKTVCVGKAADAISKEVESVPLEEPVATPAPVESETIEDLSQDTIADISTEIPAETIAETIPDTFEEETAFLSDTSVKETVEAPVDTTAEISEFLPDDIAAAIDSAAAAEQASDQVVSEPISTNTAFTEPAPAFTEIEETPSVEEPAPVVDETPSFEEPAPTFEEPAPTFEETAPVIEEPAPIVEEAAPVVEEAAPVIEETTSFVEEAAPIEETPVAHDFTAAPAAQSEAEFDDENHEILKQIAGELSALKDEISGLKLEFADLKKTSSVSTEIAPSAHQEDKSEGFFSGTDEDDTIALSGDELDNILNNADFTALQASAENTPVAEETPAPVVEEAPVEAPLSTVTEDASILGSVDVDVDIPEQDEYDNGPTDLKMDFANEKLEEPVFDTVDFNTTPSEETDADKSLPEEISIPKVEDVLVESSNTDLMNTEVTTSSAPIAPEQPAEELPEEIEEIAPEEDISTVDELPPAQAEILPADSISKPIDLFKEEEPSPLTEDKINYLAEESGINEEPVDSVFTQWNTPTEAVSVVDDTTVPEPSVLEEEPEEVAAPEEPAEQIVPKPISQNTAATDGSSIPSDMKQEIKSVLSYMDQLLENLPEDKITEFAQSEQFETYKKLFVELGLA